MALKTESAVMNNKRRDAFNGLGRFLSDELNKRRISATKFAEELDVTTSTITKAINGKTGQPSLYFLRRLATYTKTPLSVLVALSYPDVADEIDTIPPEVLTLAYRLYRLDPDVRKVIIKLVTGETLDDGQQKG